MELVQHTGGSFLPSWIEVLLLGSPIVPFFILAVIGQLMFDTYESIRNKAKFLDIFLHLVFGGIFAALLTGVVYALCFVLWGIIEKVESVLLHFPSLVIIVVWGVLFFWGYRVGHRKASAKLMSNDKYLNLGLRSLFKTVEIVVGLAFAIYFLLFGFWFLGLIETILRIIGV